MSSPAPALAEPGLLDAWRSLRGTTLGLGLGLVVIGLLFQTEIMVAIRIWIDSTAYNHCFLVIPIVGYLIWERRGDLSGLAAAPAPLAALLGIPLALMWLMSERLGIMEGRQIAVVGFVEVLFLAVFGWRLWWALSGPLLYLFFLVPFGEFLVPRLQDVTTIFIRHGLEFLQIPAYIDGYTIEIPAGVFYVAEACAGLRFLIASIAFGCLYALMMYRSPGRRAAFMIVSIVIPVIANGFRALGIVVLGNVLGSAQAAATDHVLYGWVFFSLVILLLIALGLPFRQDQMQAQRREPAGNLDVSQFRGGVLAAVAALVVAGVSPAVAVGLDRAVLADAGVAPKPLDPGLGCKTVDGGLPVPSRTPGRLIIQRIACGPALLDVQIEVFSPRTTAGPVMGERRRLSRPPMEVEDVEESWLVSDGQESRVWRLIRAAQPAFALAVGVWVDGVPARVGLPMRLRLAKTSIFGGGVSPVVVTVSPAVDWLKLTGEGRRQVENSLSEYLLSHPDLDGQIRALSGRRG